MQKIFHRHNALCEGGAAQQKRGELKYRLDTGQANLALTQGQFELHKLDLDRLIHIDVKHHLSLLTPCHFLIGRFSPLKFFYQH